MARAFDQLPRRRVLCKNDLSYCFLLTNRDGYQPDAKAPYGTALQTFHDFCAGAITYGLRTHYEDGAYKGTLGTHQIKDQTRFYLDIKKTSDAEYEACDDEEYDDPALKILALGDYLDTFNSVSLVSIKLAMMLDAALGNKDKVLNLLDELRDLPDYSLYAKRNNTPPPDGPSKLRAYKADIHTDTSPA